MDSHVNLLVTEKDGVLHYSTITGFSRLVGSQHNNDGHKYFYCYSCLHGFTLKEGEKDHEQCVLLQQHKQYCKALKPQRVSYPEGKEALLQFTNIHKQSKAPFVVYAVINLKVITLLQELLRKRKKKNRINYKKLPRTGIRLYP